MTDTTCEERALRTVNAARARRRHNQLAGMPIGTLADAGDCSIHRALRDLFPGETFEVYADRIVCESMATAAFLRRCWGPSQSKAPWAPLQPFAAALPRSLCLFVEEFDAECMPHLIAA